MNAKFDPGRFYRVREMVVERTGLVSFSTTVVVSHGIFFLFCIVDECTGGILCCSDRGGDYTTVAAIFEKI